MNSTDKPLNALESIVIGGIAGCIAKTSIAPFDRVKIHFQVASPSLGHHSGSIFGVFYAAKQVYDLDGVRGLFRGHLLTLMRIFPYAGINYFAYERLKECLGAKFHKNFGDLNSLIRVATGSTAGMCAVVCTYPLDLLRARLAFRWDRSKTSMIQNEASLLWGQAYKDPYALFRGIVPTLMGMSIYAGLSFFTFDSLLAAYSKHFSSDPPGWVRFSFGFSAGLLAQTAAYPLDVVRRRMQIYEIATHLKQSGYGMPSMARQIYLEGGISSFWRGLSINFVKVAPATGISFWAYGSLREFYHKMKYSE